MGVHGLNARKVLLVLGLVIMVYYVLIGAFMLRGRANHDTHLLWKFPLNGPRDLVADMMEDGVVSCGSTDGLYWIDGAGKEIAHVPATENQNLEAWISQGDLTLITVQDYGLNSSGQAKVKAYNKRGKPLWEFALPGSTNGSWLTISKAGVLIQQNGTQLYFLSHQGKLLWSKPMPSMSGYAALTPDGRILANSQNAVLQVYDSELKAIKLPPSGQGTYTYLSGDTLPAFHTDGSVRIADAYGLTAMSKDGAMLWQHYAASTIQPSMNPFTLWLQSLSSSSSYMPYSGYYGSSLPAVGSDGTAYYGTPDGTLYAVSASGKELWSRRLRGALRGAAVGQDGTVYVSATETGVVAYTPQGKVKWRNSGLRPINSAIAVGTNGKVYVETDKALCCLEP